jgi:hypothetical protein
MARVFQVQAFFDEEAQVYVATSDDLVGLVAEAETLDSLIKKNTGNCSRSRRGQRV